MLPRQERQPLSIELENVTKKYGDRAVVAGLTLSIATRELFVLLGPSGSGKSTVLRMIAGLTNVDSGRVLLHGRDVTGDSPRARGVGFVFQHYALFRHMTIAQNIEFALRVRGVPSRKRAHRRDELLELVELSGFGGRRPRQLSGGQQQRVALARALAHEPQVLLLDEPFGALDARIRGELRLTLRRIQHELGITAIFVTHDQEEAFELGDRLAVLDHGRLLEVGPPQDLYLRPQTEFVATFLGAANLLIGDASPAGVSIADLRIPFAGDGSATAAGGRVQVLFRPEDVALESDRNALTAPALGHGVVEQTSFAGAQERLLLRLPTMSGVRSIAPPVAFGSDYFLVEASRTPHAARDHPLRVGDGAWVGIRRFHTLAHPEMHFLIVTGASPQDRAALGLGAEIARRSQARVTLLAQAESGGDALTKLLQGAKESVGGDVTIHEGRQASGFRPDAIADEISRAPYDLIVLGWHPREGREVVEEALAGGAEHLLLVPKTTAVPTNVLVCVAVGEPGKRDVAFSARLARHLDAEAAVMTVLSEDRDDHDAKDAARRFLEGGVRTLARSGVKATTRVRTGDPEEEIRAQLSEGGHDMLVLGSPWPRYGERRELTGLLSRFLDGGFDHPLLVVRSPLQAA
jgi:sulfate/thiosulfate transport system ATP-binding protein